jgi:hypothetical protein
MTLRMAYKTDYAEFPGVIKIKNQKSFDILDIV